MSETKGPKHRRLWGVPAIGRDLGKPDSLPRHSTETHEHRYLTVAEFDGLRSGIAQCACGDTKVEWYSGVKA